MTGPATIGPAEQATRNAATIERSLGLLAAGDIGRWSELWAEDGVQETPFSPVGFPRRVEGRAAVAALYGKLPALYAQVAFPDLVTYAMADPAWIVAEHRIEAVMAGTGKPYANRYCGLFRFDPAGRIALYRAYFDPIALQEAFGDALAHSQEMHHEHS